MNRRLCPQTGVVYYASCLLDDLGVRHAFSTRIGGVSRAPFDALNLGNPSGDGPKDDAASIAENYRRFFAAAGIQGARAFVHQVHGSKVVRVERGRPHDGCRQADALASNDPARALSVRVADCVPALVASADGRCVAAVHAGWRGVVEGVVREALRDLRRMGAREPFTVAIGPCIGRERFEIGGDVLDAFNHTFGGSAPVLRRFGRRGNADLTRAVRYQLIDEGIPEVRIDSLELCTHQHSAEFFSHRRDAKRSGRMAAVIVPAA